MPNQRRSGDAHLRMVRGLTARGPAGLLLLTAAGLLFIRPSLRSVAHRNTELLPAVLEGAARLRFRSQRRWRVAATTALAAEVPELANLDDGRLSVTAGRITRRRITSATPMPEGFDGWLLVCRGSLSLGQVTVGPRDVVRCPGTEPVPCGSTTIVLLEHDDLGHATRSQAARPAS